MGKTKNNMKKKKKTAANRVPGSCEDEEEEEEDDDGEEEDEEEGACLVGAPVIVKVMSKQSANDVVNTVSAGPQEIGKAISSGQIPSAENAARTVMTVNEKVEAQATAKKQNEKKTKAAAMTVRDFLQQADLLEFLGKFEAEGVDEDMLLTLDKADLS